MSSPEANETAALEDRINALLAGKDVQFVFPSDHGRLLYRAYVHPDTHFLHKVVEWRNGEESTHWMGTEPTTNDEYQQVKANITARAAQLQQEGSAEAAEWLELADQYADKIEYHGVASREQVVSMLSDWLDEHGSDEIIPEPEEHEPAGGILDTGHGAVYVTGEGAAIFGAHIAAMQRRGARYTSF